MLLGLFQYLVVISMPVCESTAQGKIIGLIVLQLKRKLVTQL